MKVKESLNVTFDETPPPPKTSPSEDDYLIKEEVIKVNKTRPLGNDLEDKPLENNEIINIKESKSHPLDNVIEPKIINEALTDMTIIGTKWVYRNKLDKNGVVTRNKARLVAQVYNQQEGIDYDKTYAPVSKLESIRILLPYACALDFKLFQMDVKNAFLNNFINEEVYVAQPPGFINFAKPNQVYRLKKGLYRLKQVLKAWYNRLKAFLIKHDYTMGMFLKKQTALAISTTEAEYVRAGKACQQALWMKQALIDYGIRIDDISIMCDNKGAIDLSSVPDRCRTDRPLVFGLRLLKTYDGGSLAAQEFHEKVHQDGLGHNLFSVGQFCNSDLEVAFRKHSCYVQDTDGVELIKGSRGSNLSKDETPEVVIKFLKQIQVGLNKTVRNIRTDNGTKFVNKDLTDYYERVSIFYQKTVPSTPQQNNVVKRRNRTLVEAARTMLIFSKAPMFLWAEVVATAVFGDLCYPTNDSEDLVKLQPTADIGIFIGYAPSRKGTGPAPTFLTLRQIISGLLPNLVPAAPYVPPINKELEILFQPMFDEYMEPPRVERPVSPAPAVLVPVNSAGTPSSTTIDQDAPSPSHSPSSSAFQSLSLHKGIAAESTMIASRWQMQEVIRLQQSNQDYSLPMTLSKNMTVYQNGRGKCIFKWRGSKEEVYVHQPEGFVDPKHPHMSSSEESTLGSNRLQGHHGLQISQNARGIFINQSKYANEILKKFDLQKSDPVDTPMVERTKLDEDLSGTPVDQTKYRSMIGSLMYLTASISKEPSIMGLGIQKDSAMALTAFAEADLAGSAFCDCNCADTMADAEHAPEMAPPVRTDYAVDILKQNFFRAFTESSLLQAICIQQFWDSLICLCCNKPGGEFLSVILDEQWCDSLKDNSERSSDSRLVVK
ncbi:retrovirus-related pol polyprotein from transposon TNT 1-94 [Tanacetum coccineum]